MRRAVKAVFLLGLLLQAGLGCRSAGEQGGAGAAPTAPAARPAPAVEPRAGGEVIISYGVGAPRHFNPALVSGSSTAVVGAQVFASPLRYDEHWNPQPYLAERWAVAEDGLSVTLHLVEGATFHDGQPVTAEDVAFSIEVVKAYHPFKPMFAPVETVETPDAHTAVIRLSRPHPAILLAMSPALLPILPRHIYGDGQDLPTHPANLRPVGAGPFRFVEYRPGESIVLERYEEYFIPGRPYLDRLLFKLETDPRAQVVAMACETAHLLPIFSNLDGLDRLGGIEHLVVTSRGYEGLGSINWLAFNLLRPPLDDRRVRQAIAYAIDPDFIIGYLHHGQTQRAPGPISPDSPFYDPDLPAYRVDLDRAGQLLDEAGYPVRPDGARFSLALDYIPAVPSQQRDVALYLARQLARIGIEVQVRHSANWPEWAERIGNWDFDMTMDGVYNWGDPVIGVHRTYLCQNIRRGMVWTNTQNYCNPRVDLILEQAEVELNQGRRKALYREFQQIVTEEVPIVWINTLPLRTIYHTGLGNPPLSIWGVHAPLDELYWQTAPVKGYPPPPAPEQSPSPLREAGGRAIALIQEVGLYEALELFQDPAQGFMELERSGLHLIGFTDQGDIFLDNSGQTKPGMDISGILDLKGEPVLPLFLEVAAGGNGGIVQLTGVWPHPVSHQVGPMSAWCGRLSQKEVLCALAWDHDQGDAE